MTEAESVGLSHLLPGCLDTAVNSVCFERVANCLEMDSSNFLEVQNHIRENSGELEKYLLDLKCWEKEMKRKEEELKLIQTTPDEDIPPIRNSLNRSKRKNRHKKQKEKDSTTSSNTPSPIIDYQAWENFDADLELKKIDEEAKQSSESENSENEDEFCIQKRQQLAILHKDKGNAFFKNGDYDSAINSYTTGMQLDPENPLLAANRAMAFLKKEQFQAAENDCTLCLSIDPTYVKAYMRRGTARKNLNKFSLAKEDFSKTLEFEPDNKQAKAELVKLSEASSTKIGNDISETNVVKTEEMWSQFLGNKAVECAEESIPEKPKAKVSITEIEENTFVGIVKSKVKESELNKISQLEEKLQNNQIEPPLPSVPSTSFQFLTDWNEIAPFPKLRYQYLKQFPPDQLPIFFKHYMEPEIFPKLLETLSTSFIENGDDVFDYLKYLTGVGRFTTMIMFLSDKEENDLKMLLNYLKSSARPESETLYVLEKYAV